MLLAVCLILAAACGTGDGDEPVVGNPPRQEGELRVLQLAAEGDDHYDYVETDGRIEVIAPRDNRPVTLSGEGLGRENSVAEVVWAGGETDRADQRVCVRSIPVVDASTPESVRAYAEDLSLLYNVGLTLRVRPAKKDSRPTRAVVILPFVDVGKIWLFRILAISRTTKPEGTVTRTRVLGTLEFDDVLGDLEGDPTGPDFRTDVAPPPWHMCARGFGTDVSVMVWTGDEDQPSWDDPVRVKTTEISSRWVFRGFAGAYVDSLSPGQSIEFPVPEVSSVY